MFNVEEDCTFFGKADRNPKVDANGNFSNKIGSSYPCYMHTAQIEKLKASIEENEHNLSMGTVHPIEIEPTKRRLAQEKAKLESIEISKPKITPELYNKICDEEARLGSEISSALFTEYDMQKGLADPQLEANRMRLACITVDKDLAGMCNVDVDNKGKSTRSQAERMWKILRWLRTDGDAITNVEILRKRTGTDFSKSMITVPDTSHIKDMGESKNMDLELQGQEFKTKRGRPKKLELAQEQA